MAGPACRVLRAHDRVRINGTERSERRRAAIRVFSRIGAMPGLRPACRRLKAADEPPFLVRALADRRCVAIGSFMAALHRRDSSSLGARHHIDH